MWDDDGETLVIYATRMPGEFRGILGISSETVLERTKLQMSCSLRRDFQDETKGINPRFLRVLEASRLRVGTGA